MRVLLATVGAVGSIIVVGAYPFVHNHYVHPLGRLAGTVHEGQLCSEVQAAFSRYAREHANPSLQFSTPVFDHDLLRKGPVPAARGAFLYDLSLFDDLQLSARCSPEGEVVEVLFIAD